jgi:hypothetical protein
MAAFGTTANPASTDEGKTIFSGSLQQNHAIPREVFSVNSGDIA